jgi:cytochrome P450
VSFAFPEIFSQIVIAVSPVWTGRRILPSKNFNANNSLTAVRNFRRHAELRKPWNNAFKPASIANYEGMLVARAEQFVQKLKTLCKLQESNDEPIDLSMWINYFT